MLLNSKTPYAAYLWSTGASSSSINVSQPGLYWLQVKDVNDCAGTDSILINPKDCMKGFFIPTAFSPNNDGKNDLLKPLLFGNVKKYHFEIYNRSGRVVFETTDITKGWDGNLSGIKQDTNTFVWVCSYQLGEEKAKTEKGTVVLIR